MNQWLGPSSPDALITLSRTVFCGEGGPVIVEVSDSDGIDATNERLMFDALDAPHHRGGVLRRRRQYGHGRRG